MPTNDVVLVGIRFLGYAVVHNHHSVFALDPPHMWLRNPPQVGRGFLGTG
ncbi:MAG TPA: hypothetical protein VJ785_17380 [Anaerolineales bacterium]|nr:hypothetical protein [Anaerolineales bacterium]